MAKKTLCLLICENYKREAEAVVETGSLPDVKVLTFPAVCDPATDEKKPLSGYIPSSKARCGQTVFIAGRCAGQFELPSEKPAGFRLCLLDQCFYLFLNRGLIDNYLKERMCLQTPGLLDKWSQCVKELGLNRKTAKKFFKKSSAGLLLLDTGVGRNSGKKLQRFASFTGLPGETLPVGLDYFRLFLNDVIRSWRAEGVRSASAAVAGQEKRRYNRLSLNRICLVEMNDSEMVELKDISLGGIRLNVSRPLPAGRSHSVKIFPSIKSEIQLTGTVVWSSRKEACAGPSGYEMGLEFVNMDENIERSLKQFFKSLAP
ncbi:MAG: DUF1638 domain-containing protein [Nitrospiraceae bacterium]|nr:MAG: DUF1638 domain-containing protein [Nitrospiraceae bacterium]